MKHQLILKGNTSYKWFSLETFSFIGYFFDKNQKLYQEKEALDYLLHHYKNFSLENIFKNINGIFSVIISLEGKTIIISDIINYFPVFYSSHNGEIIISDDWQSIVNQRGQFDLNHDAISEYQTAGFVLMDETLDKNIYKTNASQILTLNNDNAQIQKYQSFITNSFSEDSYENLAKKAEQKLLEAGEKLITFLDQRTAIVPLSGGYDSRLIVSLLKKLGYRKVICFTYGKNNPEVPISKKVAETLGFDWHFINFETLDIPSIQSTDHYKEYLDNAANGFSMPYLMEYFAVHQLLKENLIPENSVFLPGHSGDFLGGSYILKTVKNNTSFQNLPSLIESKYFIFIKKNTTQCQQIRIRIKESLKNIGSHRHDNYDMTVEQWDLQEKLSKFIFHSSQVFNHFGFQQYFPLWDNGLIDFYRNVPFTYRENKKLYDDVAERFFFIPQDISFKNEELTVSSWTRNIQKLKDAIRYYFPWKIVLNKINNADWPYYKALTKTMLSEIENEDSKKFINFKTYNAVICNWYIKKLQKKYPS